MARFVQIAMGSGAELSYHFHLLLCRDLGMLGAVEFSRLASDADEIMRMLSALSGKLRGAANRSVVELRAKS
jgi:four helix bundle protein